MHGNSHPSSFRTGQSRIVLAMNEMLQITPNGLYCEAGDFYIDPDRPVARAVITHAHADHARSGCRHYLASAESEALMRMRLPEDSEFEFLPYGHSIRVREVEVSLHPAGHILGSAQVRLEHRGRVAVVTGDYKLGSDATCQPWEPVPCDLLVTESTFGLPVYRWPDQKTVFEQINTWWRKNRDDGKCSVLYAYAVGKSQRLLAGLDASIGPIFTHGAVEKGNEAYRQSGIPLPATTHVGAVPDKRDWRGSLVIAVPGSHGTSWIRRFGSISTAMASGWMAVRGARRRRSIDRGFVLSDHVDWTSLLNAIELCDPETVWATHGYSAVIARYVEENGRNAKAINARVRDEGTDASEDAAPLDLAEGADA